MSKDDEKNKSTLSVINGSGETRSKGYADFDSLVAAYGVDKAVARGVRSMMALPADGKISEADFVKALKEFTGQTPG